MLSQRGLPSGTVVVCPSISFPVEELRKITGIGHYEERLLFVLLGLDDPATELAYLSSTAIDPSVIEYYLSFLTIESASARRRLRLFSADDAGEPALCEKLHAQDARARLSEVLGDVEGYLLPFNVTPCEASLARALDLELLGAAPPLAYFGSKSGARRVARAAGVQVTDGAEDLHSMSEVEEAVTAVLRRNPHIHRVVIKLNNGFSGQGNAIVTGGDARLSDRSTVFCAAEESWASFSTKIAAQGCVVEELVNAPDLVSPSAQLWVHPGGEVEVLSTHDQILGGPDDQVYLGCRFPAHSDYRSSITEEASKIGSELAARGVVGPFGVDFLVRTAHPEHVALSEINLRMGGTTHPFGMARLATGGRYDAATGDLVVGETRKFYVATDNLKSTTYVGLKPGDLIEEVRAKGLAFDRSKGTGVTLHLLGALTHFGKLGAVSIGNSMEECDDLFAGFVAAIDALAQRSPVTRSDPV